ncbi:MAG: DNA translocase FtsK, partial [Pseudomonadota bacterium]
LLQSAAAREGKRAALGARGLKAAVSRLFARRPAPVAEGPVVLGADDEYTAEQYLPDDTAYDGDVPEAPIAPPPNAGAAETVPAPGPVRRLIPMGGRTRLHKGGRRSGTPLPSIDLLQTPPVRNGAVDEEALLAQAARLTEVLKEFGVRGRIIEVRPGPVVTLFELEPAAGVKSARVIALADDIARSMSATSARVAVVPGKNAIGIELPNEKRETVFFRTLLSSDAYRNTKATLPMALGEDIGGTPTVVELAKMPHLLIAGTTGSGKSVGVNAMILSLMYKLTPEQCRFIMIDPKMLELSIYEGIPHLLSPVVTDPKKAVNALKWTVREMESRYELMSKANVRNLAGFNAKATEYREAGKTLTRKVQTGFDEQGKPIHETETLPIDSIPNIVVVIDEMADLMMVAGKEIEGCIQRLAQMARAAGIHLITATQRPSVDVITGTIKANFPTRISYMVTTKIDSRTILGEQGAEQLLGMGDLLYQAPGGKTKRLHGPFVSDEEVETVVAWLKEQGEPNYQADILDDPEEGDASAVMDAMLGTSTGNGDEDLYAQAMAVVLRDKRASTSYLQRRLKIGYNRAATLIEQLEDEGVISAPNHAGKREILALSEPPAE